MSVVIVGKGGTLGALLEARLRMREVSAIELRCPDPADDSAVPELAKAKVVINVGGPRVRRGLDWADYFREHVGVTTRIVRSMSPGSHLVHVSSTAVFGARQNSEVLKVEDPPAPTQFPSAAYACAKLSAELVARAAATEGRELAVTVLRPSMVYGPNVDSALESIRKLSQKGIALKLLPADTRQHLVHVDLLVDAVERAAETRPRSEHLARVLIVADPFVLRNSDLAISKGIPLAIPLGVATKLPSNIAGVVGQLEALQVLAMDNEFDSQALFDELGLDPLRYQRPDTFDRYWSES